mmetsp:Transcript_34599/g.79685  ORF Transcript_34599/g.79685 Transcript_34599/m.79685 type:complete len:297 (-) Transcript_34599:169-1059(-)
MAITLHILGTGAGRTSVYDDEPSSAWALAFDRRPFFLADVGLGVCKQAQRYLGEIPSTILISHNHSDHAGELPVVLAVEGLQKNRDMCVIAETEVMQRLLQHRMHELRSTGRALDDFASWLPVPEGQPFTLHCEAGVIQVTLIQAQHSEVCFGALFEIGGLTLGWTADSGFSPQMLEAMRRPNILLMDARKVGGPEHASFKEIVDYVAANEDVEFLGTPVSGHLFTPREGICQIAVLGYGSAAEAPTKADGIPSSAVLRLGQVIVLRKSREERVSYSFAYIAGFLCGAACSICCRD